MLACPACRECSLLTPWGGVSEWVRVVASSPAYRQDTNYLLKQTNLQQISKLILKYTFSMDYDLWYLRFLFKPWQLRMTLDPTRSKKRAPYAKANLTIIQSTSNKAPSPHRCDRYMWGAKDNAGAKNEGQHEHRRYVASFVNIYLLIVCLCFRSLFSQGQKQSGCEQKG